MHTVIPIEPWIRKTRGAIICVGLSWPVLFALFPSVFNTHGFGGWFIVAYIFMLMLYLVVCPLTLLFLPTYKSRIIIIPPTIFFILLVASRGHAGIVAFLVWPSVVAALSLLVPQSSTVEMDVRSAYRSLRKSKD